jgi:transposase InsO family protein
MLHLDVKKLARVKGIGHRITGDRRSLKRGIGWEYIHVCIDDATRVAYVEAHKDERGITTAGFLERAVAYYGQLGIKTRRILTDNGSNYASYVFAHACARARVRHRRTRPYTPRTNGKAERFIQSTTERRRVLRNWLRHYNERRTHTALGTTPLARLASRARTTSWLSTTRRG